MNKRDIVIGLVVLIILTVAVYLVRRPKAPELSLDETSGESQRIVESKFNLTIPENVKKIDLTNVAGYKSHAIATRKYVNGLFTHTILSDLPDPAFGTFYQGWLVRGKAGEPNFAAISTGKLELGKGGYILNFESKTNYSDYKGVVITLEKVDDSTPEAYVMEGSF